MEHIQKTRVTAVEPITSRTVVFGLLIFFSVLFGILNFVVPTHYLMAIIFITVVGIVLFLNPFVGLLTYQFITIIQPGVIFPSLHALHPERLMAIFLMVSLIINIKLRRGKLMIIEHKLLYYLAFFILAMGISIPTSYWKGQSFDMMIDFLKTMIYILLILNIVNSERRLKIFLWEYLLLIGYMAASSAIAYKTGNVMEAQGIIRAQGLAGQDPNSLAVTLCLALPFHFLLLRMEKSWFLKGLSLFIVTISIYTMILTGSRGGFIGLMSVTLLGWWVLPKRGIRLFILAAAAFIVVSIMPPQYQERYATIFQKQRDASSEERIKVWNKGLRMFFDHPFTGVGTGAFGTANAEGYSEGRKSYLKAHNLYIQCAAELGLVGMITFALYVGHMLAYQKRYRRAILDKFKNKDWLWGCLIAMTVSIVTLLIVGMFGHNLYRSNWYYYGGLTVTIGMILNLKFKKQETATEENGA